MLQYTLDIARDSVWKRTTPSEAGLSQAFYCTEAGLFYAGEHFSTARSDKDSYLLFYTLRGAGFVEQDETLVRLQPGQALLINCRTPQRYYTDPDAALWHHYWIHLDGSGVAALEPFLLPDKKISPATVDGERITELFEIAMKEMDHGTIDSLVQCGLVLHEMLVQCLQGRFAQQALDNNRQVILQAARHLRHHYQEDIRLWQLLEEAHMSKSYFLRLFRNYIGTTPYNYLVNYRITKAKELLVLTNRTISEIAGEVGFGDASNFSTRFSEITGQSPLQYRKSMLQSI